MAQPVLVRAYTNRKGFANRAPGRVEDAEALPPISSYAFADILRSVNGSKEFQNAIDGIAEIAAKNRMSLAEEYGSHMPPVGEITATGASAVRSQPHRPVMRRRALTSVPEASSGSSEGSRKSPAKKGSIFRFRKQQKQDCKPMQRMRIGSMGRTIPVGTTVAMAVEVLLPADHTRASSETTIAAINLPPGSGHEQRSSSAAQSSLQRLLAGTGLTSG
ncbi:hypothetical protein HII31_09383 [Pseudocercospora fuligena]|uniref:Uncharacterized protein n=1 Tax=Pseudocercospora fuligena TaxID=685502 RepID=A0A8H6VJN8_9PEZI|nr:hypothetical protein HII31_09383 [Pseudocercospora fuligena]